MNHVMNRLPLTLLLLLNSTITCIPSFSAQPLVNAADAGVANVDPAKLQHKNSSGKWSINSQSSTVKFHLKNMGLPVNGSFSKVSGTVTYDGQRLNDAEVDAKVDLSSIDTGISMRDHHLKTKDFFDVEKFSQAEFVSTKIEPLDNGSVRIIGNFKLHGISQSLALKADQLEKTTDTSGHEHLRTKATTTISRKHFKIGGMTAATIGNDVSIELSLDLIPAE